MRGFVRKGTTGDASGLQFVAGALNCAVWVKYGFFIQDTPIIAVNCVGNILLASYALCYYRYAPCRLSIQKQMVFALGFFATLYVYVGSVSFSDCSELYMVYFKGFEFYRWIQSLNTHERF